MGDQRPAVDASSVQWETLTSKNGVPFRVGTKKQTDNAAEKKSTRIRSDFGVDLDWPVDDLWKTTTKEVESATAITQYRLSYKPGADYEYELVFTNTAIYNYRFEDGGNNHYPCNTWSTGDHWVLFNSKKPNMVHVNGTVPDSKTI